MKYRDEYPLLTHEEIGQAFQSGNIATICQTLVGMALYDEDGKMVEGYCLQYLEHPDAGVRMVAATCIGHLARIHRQLDLDLVLPALYRHQSDTGPYVAGTVDNALSCIERFMDIPVKRDPAMKGEMVEEEKEVDEEDDDDEEQPLTAKEIEQAFQSGNSLEINRTLTHLSLHDPDWQKVEHYCLQFLEYPDDNVQGIAVQCISRLVYKHKQLDVDLVLPALYQHRSDSNAYVVKNVEYALNTIATILNVPVQDAEKDAQEPTNGQRALDNSVSLKSKSTRRRIGVDLNTGEVVAFDEDDGSYHGQVRTWDQLTRAMKNALNDNGLIDTKGNVILRDARGNIIGSGKNVFKRGAAKNDISVIEEDDVAGEDDVVWETDEDENDKKEVTPLTREMIEQVFQSDDLMEISRMLLALALHDPDWRRTEDYCLQFLEHANAGMRGFAAECISHLIYNQHHLDLDRARSALYRHQSDPDKTVVRKVNYALDDLELFEQTLG